MIKIKLRNFATICLFLMLFVQIQPVEARWNEPKSERTNNSPEFSIVRIYFSNRQELETLAGKLDIWEVHHDEGWLLAQVSERSVEWISSNGFLYEIDHLRTAKLKNTNRLAPGQTSGIPGYSCYRTVEETDSSLQNLVINYPTLAKSVDIGDSWEKIQPGGGEGYDLWVTVLTNQAIPGPKPRFFLMSAVHAREYVTAETATRFAEYLLLNYGVDPDVTWMLDYFELHLLPQANPDGRKIAETGVSWRKNTDNDDGCSDESSWGVDLNRNSSYQWGGDGASSVACDLTYRGPSAASEPEIQAMENYVRSMFPDQRGPTDNDPAPKDKDGLFITLHSYGKLILWPWGHTSSTAPNHLELQTLGRKMAFLNHYTPQASNLLYSTSGTNDEFAYGELGVAAYTYEMGDNFFEKCQGFEDVIFPNNLDALKIAFKATRRPYQDPSGPEALDLAVSSPIIEQGLPVMVTVTVDDTRYLNLSDQEPVQLIQEVVLSLDVPNWSESVTTQYNFQAQDGAFDESKEIAELVLNTSDLTVGRHMLFVQGKDSAGNPGLISAVFLEITPGAPIIRDLHLFIPWMVYAAKP